MSTIDNIIVTPEGWKQLHESYRNQLSRLLESWNKEIKTGDEK